MLDRRNRGSGGAADRQDGAGSASGVADLDYGVTALRRIGVTGTAREQIGRLEHRQPGFLRFQLDGPCSAAGTIGNLASSAVPDEQARETPGMQLVGKRDFPGG